LSTQASRLSSLPEYADIEGKDARAEAIPPENSLICLSIIYSFPIPASQLLTSQTRTLKKKNKQSINNWQWLLLISWNVSNISVESEDLFVTFAENIYYSMPILTFYSITIKTRSVIGTLVLPSMAENPRKQHCSIRDIQSVCSELFHECVIHASVCYEKKNNFVQRIHMRWRKKLRDSSTK